MPLKIYKKYFSTVEYIAWKNIIFNLDDEVRIIIRNEICE